MTMKIKFWQQHCIVQRPKKPYAMAGFEPGIFWSGGGRDGHSAILFYFISSFDFVHKRYTYIS
jgi:hypothetical protein